MLLRRNTLAFFTALAKAAVLLLTQTRDFHYVPGYSRKNYCHRYH